MDQVSQIREKIDLVALISEYVALKKTGHNFKGLCPFHTEKTPSFVVSPERQIWHCFGGCAKGGDAFTFLMEYEHIEFPEALRILAKKAGVILQEKKGFDTQSSSKKEKIYAINHLTSEFYHYILTHHTVGRPALEYLTVKRGIKLKVIDTFMLGFSPHSKRSLSDFLIKKKGFTKDDLFEAGLIKFRGKEYLDFFQGRIMFPLFDHRDNIVGFSGRILQDKGESKYINTKETLVYNKGSHFFGLNVAKGEIKKENKVYITEGEFDVISCFQEGISNVVASKGTALTANQIQLLARFTKKTALCFDMDKAGIEATKRSIPILQKYDISATVVETPLGKDPDEAIKTDPFAFKKALKQEIDLYEFLIQYSLKRYDKNTIAGKKEISQEVLPILSRIDNEIIKEHYLRRISSELDVSYESVVKEVEKIEKKEVAKEVIIENQNVKRNREDVLEEYLLGLIVQHQNPFELVDVIDIFLQPYEFKNSSFEKILQRIKQYKMNKLFDIKVFAKNLPKELVPFFDRCFLLPLAKFESDDRYRNEIKKTCLELREIFTKKRIKLLKDMMKEKEKNEQDFEKLNQEFSSLVSILRRN